MDKRFGGLRWVGMMSRLMAVVGSVGVLCCLSGCGSGSGLPGAHPHTANTPPPSGQVASVRILQTIAVPGVPSPPPSNQPAGVVVTDPDTAQHLYDALLALPPFPKGPRACTAELGPTYSLTFYRADQTEALRASVQAYSCREADLSNGEVRQALSQNHFWVVLAAAFGVSK